MYMGQANRGYLWDGRSCQFGGETDENSSKLVPNLVWL